MKSSYNESLMGGSDKKEDEFHSIPPRNILTFGKYRISREYRDALYEYCPEYTAEEIVGSYLGHNPHFPSEDGWLEELKEDSETEME